MTKNLCLISAEMFNAPGMLRWARHFYRMPRCPKADKKYFLNIMKSWVKDDYDAEYCLSCDDSCIEWENEQVTITIHRTEK